MHPPPDRLDAFGRGDLSEAEAAAIEDHLAACPSCLEWLGRGLGGDELIELLRVADRGSARIPAGDGPVPPIPTVGPDGYDIIGPIGRGGMGVVYRANQRGLGRTVALKQIRAGLDADAHDLARFRAEAEAAARLRHANIVQVYDVGLRDGLPYIAMELVEGESLAERLRRGPLRPREAAELVMAVAGAIRHAHGAGIVHRDLKPANILLGPEGTPKVVDFGLAKRLDSDPGPTHTGALIGTPGYMAPEQAAGQPVGCPADIYALGATLYECLTGRPPFQGATPLETLEQARDRDPPTPDRLRPGIPRDLRTICMKCLEKEPRRRYESASGLADDLDRFLRGRPIVARPVGLLERGLKWSRRRPSHAALVGLGIAVSIGGVAGLLGHQARLRAEIARANQSAQEAKDQRAQADANYRAAREAIREILGKTEDPGYSGIPRVSELRQAQNESALGFYDRILAAADSPDPAVRLDRAIASREAANLQIGLGKLGPAERNLDLALEIFSSLAADRLGEPDFVREHMTAWIKLAVLLGGREGGRPIDAARSARDLAEKLVAMEGNSWQGRADLAWCEHVLGTSFLSGGREPDAEEHYRRAVSLRRALLGERPGAAGIRVELAGSLVNLGLIASKGRAEQAEADFSEAGRLMEASLATAPEDPGYVIPYAQLLINWGNLAAARGEAGLALGRFGRGLERIGPMIAKLPDAKEPRFVAMSLHGSRANLLVALGRHAEAVADWDRVVELNDVPAELATYRLLRLTSLLKSGDHRRGIAEVEAIAEGLPPGGAADPADLYNFACFCAIASAFAGRDPALSAGERAAAAGSHADRALRWLRRCADAGFFRDPANRDHARSDSDLGPIRDRLEFSAIVETAPAAPNDGFP